MMTTPPDPFLYLRLSRHQLTPSVIRQLAMIMHHDVSIAFETEVVWLKIRLVAKNQRWMDRLPGDRYRGEEFGLRRWNQKTVSEPMPNGDWLRLRDSLELLLPFAFTKGITDESSDPENYPSESLRLTRGGEPRDPAAIQLPMEPFAAWVEASSDSDLDILEYICADNEVLVRGKRLPPIAGEYWIELDRILIPAGYHWLPKVDSSFVRKLLGASQEQWVWWPADGQPQFVENECWGQVTRRSVRAERNPPGGRP